MKVEINRARCKECGLCIHNCPKKCISKSDELNAAGYYPVQIDDEADLPARRARIDKGNYAQRDHERAEQHGYRRSHPFRDGFCLIRCGHKNLPPPSVFRSLFAL